MRKLSEHTKKSLVEKMNKLANKIALEDDLDKLQEYKDQYELISKMLDTHWTISPDTVAIIAGNLLGILLILNYEKLNVVSTKALGFVLRGRV